MTIEFEQSYWDSIDGPIYSTEIAPFLPERVFDFHAHIWRLEDFDQAPSDATRQSASLVFVTDEFRADHLLAATKCLFPDKEYRVQAFGFPFDEINDQRNNQHVSENVEMGKLESALLLVRPGTSAEQIKDQILTHGFVGIKPYWTYVNWKAQNDVLLTDMLTNEHMKAVDELGCLVLIHLPRKGRLADRSNLEALERMSGEYPRAKLVIAHVGRAYCEWPAREALHKVEGLPNIYFDTTFIQNSVVFQMLFEHVDSSRVFYGSDLPNSAVHGQVVCVNGINLFITRDPYPWSLSRQSEPIRATYMAYESIRAIRDGALRAGLPDERMVRLFYENGMEFISSIREGLAVKA